MIRTVIGTCGVLLLLLSLFLFLRLKQDERQAQARDDIKTSYGIIGGLPLCDWEVESPDRVMSEDRSQAIVVKVNNTLGEDCQSVITLSIPGFDISPAKDEQIITLTQDQKGSLSWIITPRRSGAFNIAISDPLNTKIFGITVTNVFGLNALHAKIVSILGSIFGPMLTIPWWWEKILHKKRNKQ